MRDRVPTKPNRYAVYDDAHNFLRYEYHERADEPTQVGDPLNKANLLPDTVATALGLTGNPLPKDALAKLSGAALREIIPLRTPTTVASLTVGNVCKIDNVEFLVVANNHFKADSKLLVLRVPTTNSYIGYGMGTKYANSALDTYCNTTFPGELSLTLASLLQDVTISSNGVSLSRKAFSLSLSELGLPTTEAIVEGTAIPYFNSNDSRKIGQMYYTRTAATTPADYHWLVNSSGERSKNAISASALARPAFVLDNTVTLYQDHRGDYYTTQDYSSILTDMLGNDFPLPYAKIAIGSYTGTGTFGQSNKNSLTLPFTPIAVFISGKRVPDGIVQQGIFIAPSVMGMSFGLDAAPSTSARSVYNVALAWDGGSNTLSWWAESAVNQLNASPGWTYEYAAIGLGG